MRQFAQTARTHQARARGVTAHEAVIRQQSLGKETQRIAQEIKQV